MWRANSLDAHLMVALALVGAAQDVAKGYLDARSCSRRSYWCDSSTTHNAKGKRQSTMSLKHTARGVLLAAICLLASKMLKNAGRNADHGRSTTQSLSKRADAAHGSVGRSWKGCTKF